MTEAQARAWMDQMAPPEQRLPMLATAEEIARVRAWMVDAPESWEPGAVEVFYGESARAMASAAAFCGMSGLSVGALISELILPFWCQVERYVGSVAPISAEQLEAVRAMKLGLQAEMYAIAGAHKGGPPVTGEIL